jgi:hypothetical protein
MVSARLKPSTRSDQPYRDPRLPRFGTLAANRERKFEPQSKKSAPRNAENGENEEDSGGSAG